MTTTTTDTELAWLAGLYDGEGYVTVIRASSPGRPVRMQAWARLHHTHEPTVEAVVDVLTRAGVSEVAVSRRRPASPARHKPSLYAQVCRPRDLALMANLLRPYSVTKREQWRLVGEWVGSRLAQPRGAAYTELELELAGRLAVLNQRGPKVAECLAPG